MMHEWSTMKRLIYLRGNPATGGGGSPLTVTGATPLLMPGALSKPMRKATFAIEAVQAGSGDPSPQNIRAITGHSSMTAWVTGANVCPQLDAANAIKYNGPALAAANSGNGIAVTGQTGSSHACGFVLFKADTFIGKVLYFSCDMTSNGTPRALLLSCDSDFSNISTIAALSSSTTASAIVPQTAEGKYLGISLYSTIGTDSYSTVSTYTNISLTMSEPTSYVPYSGSSLSVEFPAMGKNLLDTSSVVPWTNQGGLTLTKNADGSFTVNGTATSMMYQQLTIYLKAGTYTMTGGPAGGSASGYSIFIGDGLDKYDFGNGSTFTVANDGYYRMACPRIAAGTVCDNLTFKPMIQTGSSATTYEPFTNTVYGGTIDPVTGEGVVTHKKIVLADTLDIRQFIQTADGYSYALRSLSINEIKTGILTNFLSTNYTPVGVRDINSSATAGKICCYSAENNQFILVTSTETTVEGFRNELTANGAYVVVPIETPIPFTIPPQSLTPPAGDAYIWADCGSSAEVTYIGKP